MARPRCVAGVLPRTFSGTGPAVAPFGGAVRARRPRRVANHAGVARVRRLWRDALPGDRAPATRTHALIERDVAQLHPALVLPIDTLPSLLIASRRAVAGNAILAWPRCAGTLAIDASIIHRAVQAIITGSSAARAPLRSAGLRIACFTGIVRIHGAAGHTLRVDQAPRARWLVTAIRANAVRRWGDRTWRGNPGRRRHRSRRRSACVHRRGALGRIRGSDT